MPTPAISIETVTPWPLAAVRRQVTRANLASTVVSAPIWSLVDARGLPNRNETVVVYHDDGTGLIDRSPEGVAVDVGVLLDKPFEGDSLLHCVMTPAGRVAHLQHRGGYDVLPKLQEELRQWCLDQGHALGGVNWVHFSFWHEEAEQRITDIYYLLD